MLRFGYLILLVWFGLTLLVLDSAPAPRAWTEWPPDNCRRTNCYCEPIRDRLIAQPAATYSSLGFVVVGLFVLRAAARFPTQKQATTSVAPALMDRPLMRNHRAYPLVYGLSLLCTGFFSFFYHASLTKLGDYLDLMGMYLFTGYLMLYNLSRLRPMSILAFAAAYLSLNAALALGLVVAYGLQQIYFGTLVAIALYAEVWIHRFRNPNIQLRYLSAALACFGLGAILWLTDSNGLLPCNPASPINWHALWHLAVAASAGLLFLYYRSEKTGEGARGFTFW